jgi:Domain of unknown function (DUF5624)
MNNAQLKQALLFVIAFIISLPLFSKDSSTSYTTPKAFMSLYYDFTGSSNKGYPKGKVNISQDLFKTMSKKTSTLSNDNGPLILFVNSDLYIYDNNRKRLLSLVMRTAPDSGFNEMTAISHIGPALAYAAYIKSKGDDSWKSALLSLKKSIIAVKTVNAQKQNNWVTKLNAPSWKPYESSINNMIDYACSMAGNYIGDVLSGKKQFNMASLQSDFLDGNTDYPIPFNNIMIGTFMLTAYESMNKIHQAVSKVDVDWENAKVLIRFVAGSNITAGVSVDSRSNWLVPFIIGLSKNKLPLNRIFIAPYAEVKSSLGQEMLSESDFNYYSYAWSRTYNRTKIANAVFTNITSIFIPKRPVIPGDFRFSKEPDMNEFLMRLKYSLANPTEMLSNTVAFWMSGELHSNDWDLSKVKLPGFTTGFPKGISSYPANNPEIK